MPLDSWRKFCGPGTSCHALRRLLVACFGKRQSSEWLVPSMVEQGMSLYRKSPPRLKHFGFQLNWLAVSLLLPAFSDIQWPYGTRHRVVAERRRCSVKVVKEAGTSQSFPEPCLKALVGQGETEGCHEPSRATVECHSQGLLFWLLKGGLRVS